MAPKLSDHDSDEDSMIHDARDSAELAEFDRRVLEEEEERETLLAGSSAGQVTNAALARNGAYKKQTKQKRRSKGRKGGHGDFHDETGELMYEMEEGGPHSETSSMVSSTTSLAEKTHEFRPASKTQKASICTIITTLIVLLFCGFTFGAYRATRSLELDLSTVTLRSNGSSIFAPTTILISLDGFRADFLERGITPTLKSFMENGVSPRYMLPSFPSVTFPNHFTLVTGLYPEAHGIVGNSFWDPELKEEFFYTDPARSMRPKWWAAGEPIWVTAEKKHVKTAVHMWPGSEARMDFSATYLDKYNSSELLSRKTRRILELLDMPSPTTHKDQTRPQLIAAYVPDIDADGHKFGPNSTEIRDTISNVDKMLQNLFNGLEERNLTQIVNVVIVSDHGMATTSTSRLIQFDNLLNVSLIEHTDGWPLYGLRPKNPLDLRGLYNTLNIEASRSPNFDVYLRDEDMPARYHFTGNPRIAPLWIVPKTGWAIVNKDEFDVAEAQTKGIEYTPKGLHGYDHEHPLMRAIFIARGPAFPHTPGSRLDIFQNTEVYNIICDSLEIEPRPNNGTLRLPLKPVGLHSDGNMTDATPIDFDTETETISPADEPSAVTTADNLTITSGTKHENNTSAVQTEKGKPAQKFWTYMKAKLNKAMDWAHKVMQKMKSNKANDDTAAAND